MTKDDIIKLAHEAGLHLATDVHWMPIIGFDYAEKFANLVAAAEREEISKLLEEYPHWLGTVGKREIAAAIRGTT